MALKSAQAPRFRRPQRRRDGAEARPHVRSEKHGCCQTCSGPVIIDTISEARPELLDDVLAPLPRAALVPVVQAIVGVTRQQAVEIVEAFDTFVAAPLEANLKRLTGRDLAKRNPMIYTARGTTTVDEWVDQVLADKETSAIENHIGMFMEEVARVVSGGIKPGSGVGLQVDRADGVIELYAIQSSPNTKNSGGRRADMASLKRAAKALRASRRTVELYVAVLGGRRKTASVRDEPDITVLGSDDFWARIAGIADFRARLLKATVALAPLVKKRAADEVARIRAEARELYGDQDGGLNLDAVASPPVGRARRRAAAPEAGEPNI